MEIPPEIQNANTLFIWMSFLKIILQFELPAILRNKPVTASNDVNVNMN